MGKRRSIVIVHRNPDLDAVACAVAARMSDPEVEVRFLRGNEPELPPWARGEDVRVLDHDLGIKGELTEEGRRRAAVLSMPEATDFDPFLLEEIDEQDRTGRSKARFTLATVLSAIKGSLLAQGKRGRELDEEVIERMGMILDGINALHKLRLAAPEVADRVSVVELPGFKLAIVPKGPSMLTLGTVLANRGIDAGVYQNGFQVGVNRYPTSDEPDLRKLADLLPGWFIHPGGWLAAWGTSKAPVFGPPPAGTPQDQEELVRLVVQVFGGEARCCAACGKPLGSGDNGRQLCPGCRFPG